MSTRTENCLKRIDSKKIQPPILSSEQHTLSGQLLGFGAGLLAVFLYAITFVVSRKAVTGIFSPQELATIRYLSALVFLLPILLFKSFRGSKIGIKAILIFPIFAGYLYMLLIYEGLKYAPASHVSLLNSASVPIFITIYSVLKKSEPWKWRYAMNFFMLIAGISLVLGLNFTVAFDNEISLYGDGLFLVSGISWAIYVILLGKSKLNPLESTLAVCTGSAIYILLSFILNPINFHLTSASEILYQSLIQGLLATVAAMLLFNYSVRILGSIKSTFLSPLIPIVTAILSCLVLNEPLTFVQWLGAFIVVLAIIDLNRNRYFAKRK